MLVASDSQAGEKLDGCPVVRLSESPQDVRHLLRVLVGNTQRRDGVYQPPKEHNLSALVRLAHKDCIEDVEEQAPAYPKTNFTDRYDSWRSSLEQPAQFDCSDIPGCSDMLVCPAIIGELWRYSTTDKAGLAIAHPWTSIINDSSLCAACMASLKASDGTLCRQLWRELPSSFKLPLEGWDTDPV
ncbi:hypothetical protein BD413DRAFT_168312 [Trametes elegans]|nr:hypothetical protein BD413DRAFT_168312 [Trametes elegans]